MAFRITSEFQLIDIAQINRGRSQIDEGARRFIQVGNSVSSVNCGANALSVNGRKTMQSSIDNLGRNIRLKEG